MRIIDIGREPRTVYAIALVISLGLAGLLAYWVSIFAVNIPFWDEWSLSDTLVKYRDGNLTLSDLLSQYNESRKLFPRLIMILNAEWFRWDVRLQMGLSVLIALSTFGNLLLLLRRSELSVRGQTPMVLLSGLLVFSPVQGHNYLMGIQFISFAVAWLLTANLLIAGSDASPRMRYIATALLSFVATYTFANGMIVWVLTFPILAASRSGRRVGLDILWLLAFAATLLLYFWDYATPSAHPEFGATVGRLGETANFFVTFLGSSLGRAESMPSPLASTIAGSVLVAAGVAVLIGCGFRVRDRGLGSLEPLLPWAALALYGFASAAVAALGRTPFGLLEALASRYVTVSIYAVLGIAMLGTLLLKSDSEHKRSQRRADVPIRFAWQAGLASVILLTALGYPHGYYTMRQIHELRQQAYAAFASKRITNEDTQLIFPPDGQKFLLRRFVHLSHLALVDESLRHFEILVPTDAGDN